MGTASRFPLVYAPDAIEHLDFIGRKYRRLIQEEIENHLVFTPEVQTRNRKPLEQPAPFKATWELRCGPGNRFRVFYRFDLEAAEVRILAIGTKVRSQLFFAGKEFEP